MRGSKRVVGVFQQVFHFPLAFLSLARAEPGLSEKENACLYERQFDESFPQSTGKHQWIKSKKGQLCHCEYS